MNAGDVAVRSRGEVEPGPLAAGPRAAGGQHTGSACSVTVAGQAGGVVGAGAPFPGHRSHRRTTRCPGPRRRRWWTEARADDRACCSGI